MVALVEVDTQTYAGTCAFLGICEDLGYPEWPPAATTGGGTQIGPVGTVRVASCALASRKTTRLAARSTHRSHAASVVVHAFTTRSCPPNDGSHHHLSVDTQRVGPERSDEGAELLPTSMGGQGDCVVVQLQVRRAKCAGAGNSVVAPDLRAAASTFLWTMAGVPHPI